MRDFISLKEYTNRYRDVYSFTPVKDNHYKFELEHTKKNWMRVGGKEGQHFIDADDLGMIDPSGGPFLSCGEFSIDGRKVERIYCLGNDYFFEVEKV